MLNRFFGTSKAAPKATLHDAISSTDARVDSVEVKIKKLDAELLRYKEQMAKMREGPGKVGSRRTRQRARGPVPETRFERVSNALGSASRLKPLEHASDLVFARF